jgi:uncharacterized membrane protein
MTLALVLPAAVRADDRRHSDARVTIRDLGTASGVHAAAFAINDRGQVVGTAISSAHVTAVIWDRQGHVKVITNEEAQAFDINNAGVVLGIFEGRGASSALARTGFIWSSSGGLTELPDNFSPTAINNRGHVVGRCFTPNPQTTLTFEPCVWINGNLRSLAPGTAGSTVGISDNGYIVGGLNGLPVIWKPNGRVVGIDESALAENQRFNPAAVNDRGEVAGRILRGSSFNPGNAATWQRGVFSILPLGTAAADINESGCVVGTWFHPGAVDHGFVWCPSNAVIELAGLAGTPAVTNANAINAHGEIAGVAVDEHGVTHAVVWTIRHLGVK